MCLFTFVFIILKPVKEYCSRKRFDDGKSVFARVKELGKKKKESWFDHFLIGFLFSFVQEQEKVLNFSNDLLPSLFIMIVSNWLVKRKAKSLRSSAVFGGWCSWVSIIVMLYYPNFSQLVYLNPSSTSPMPVFFLYFWNHFFWVTPTFVTKMNCILNTLQSTRKWKGRRSFSKSLGSR